MSKIKILLLRLRQSSFAKDSFWALIGNIAAKGMTLVGSIVVARILGKDIFGEYGTVKGTLVNIAIFSTFGLGYTATKYVAEYKKSNPKVLRDLSHQAILITLIVSGIMAIILFATAGFVAESILKAAHLTFSFRLLAVWIVFNALTSTQVGILSGFNAFKTMAKINTYIGLFAFSSSIILAYFFLLEGALLSLLLTQVLNWYLNYTALNKVLPETKETLSNKLFKKILNFSLPIALQEGLYAISSWIILLLLVEFGGYGEVGLYTAAIQWSAVILFVPGILRNVILSHLSEKTNNQKEHNKVLKYTLLINLIATVSPFLIIWIVLPMIINFYGPTFDGLYMVLFIVIFTTIFMSLNNVFSQAYMSKEKNWMMFFFRFGRDVLVILLFIVLSQKSNNGALNLALSILVLNFIFLIIISTVYFRFVLKH